MKRKFRTISITSNFLLSLLAATVLGITSQGKAAANEKPSAADVVAEFCRWEFTASPDMDRRQELVSFSERVKKERKERMPKWMAVHYVEWRSDPRIIVSSYKIESVKSGDDKSIATVRYHVVGKTQKEEIFSIESPHDEIATLTLKKISGTWKVIDPPEIHVSKDATLMMTKHDLEKTEKLMKHRKAAQYQADVYARLKKAVETLEKMGP